MTNYLQHLLPATLTILVVNDVREQLMMSPLLLPPVFDRGRRRYRCLLLGRTPEDDELALAQAESLAFLGQLLHGTHTCEKKRSRKGDPCRHQHMAFLARGRRSKRSAATQRGVKTTAEGHLRRGATPRRRLLLLVLLTATREGFEHQWECCVDLKYLPPGVAIFWDLEP